jgi:hypothetical protein
MPGWCIAGLDQLARGNCVDVGEVAVVPHSPHQQRHSMTMPSGVLRSASIRLVDSSTRDPWLGQYTSNIDVRSL